MSDREIYQYGGRGADSTLPDEVLIRPNQGYVLLLTKKFGSVEFSLCYCESVILTKWGMRTQESFVSMINADCSFRWAEKIKDKWLYTCETRIYMTPIHDWMLEFEGIY